jgi:hypothetical protein
LREFDGKGVPFSIPSHEEDEMARKTITVTTSDWSGKEIPDEKEAWQLTLTSGDGRKALWTADLTEAEANELKARDGREQKRRGRKPRAQKRD